MKQRKIFATKSDIEFSHRKSKKCAHKKAYKTSFGQWYCPDEGRNIVREEDKI